MVGKYPAIRLAMRTLGSLNSSRTHLKMKKIYPGLMLMALAVVLHACSAESPQEEEDLYAGALLGNEKITVDPVAMEDRVLELENRHRADLGLAPLEEFPAVHKYAEAHNEYMISKNDISHNNFDARAEKVAEASNAKVVSENVARYYYTAERVLEGWLESSSHRKALEGEYTHTTVSVLLDKAGRPYFTQLFLKL